MLVNKDRLKAELDRDGYAVVRGFMSAAEIVGLNQRIDALAARVGELGEGTAYYEVAGRPETMMRLLMGGFASCIAAAPAAIWRRSCWRTKPYPRVCSGSPSPRGSGR